MQLLSTKSMSRNLPPKGTAALDLSLVKGWSLSPAPPAIIIVITLSTLYCPVYLFGLSNTDSTQYINLSYLYHNRTESAICNNLGQ